MGYIYAPRNAPYSGYTPKRPHSHPATTKQMEFLEKLRTEYSALYEAKLRHEGDTAGADAVRDEREEWQDYRPTIDAASKLIGDFIEKIRVLKTQPRRVTSIAGPVELEDAIYVKDGRILKVVHAVHGSGKQYAKSLDVETGEWTYEGRGPLHGLTAEHRMTLDQAKEYGALYGVCCNCGRTLTNETSIEAGIGPVCARRFA